MKRWSFECCEILPFSWISKCSNVCNITLALSKNRLRRSLVILMINENESIRWKTLQFYMRNMRKTFSKTFDQIQYLQQTAYSFTAMRPIGCVMVSQYFHPKMTLSCLGVCNTCTSNVWLRVALVFAGLASLYSDTSWNKSPLIAFELDKKLGSRSRAWYYLWSIILILLIITNEWAVKRILYFKYYVYTISNIYIYRPGVIYFWYFAHCWKVSLKTSIDKQEEEVKAGASQWNIWQAIGLYLSSDSCNLIVQPVINMFCFAFEVFSTVICSCCVSLEHSIRVTFSWNSEGSTGQTS